MTPKAPPAGAKGFFDALKPNSPLFSQTTRVNVRDPKAQLRTQARVVPPARKDQAPAPKRTPQQEITRAKGAHRATGSNPLSTVTHALEVPVRYAGAHPVRTAVDAVLPGPLSALANPLVGKALGFANRETNTALGALARGQAGPNLQHQASVNASVLQGLQGIPYAAQTAEHQSVIRHAYAGLAKAMAANPSYNYAHIPNLEYYSAADKKKLGLPPTSTDADVIHLYASQLGHFGHRNFVEQVIHSAPLDFVGQAAGPVALSYMMSRALQGDFSPVKEFALQNKDFAVQLGEHPETTIAHHPITSLALAASVLRGGGGAVGTFARSRLNPSEGLAAALTPHARDVNVAGYHAEVPGESTPAPLQINRGMTSTKADEALAQAASDWMAAHFPRVGRRVARGVIDQATKTNNREFDMTQKNFVDPTIRAGARLSKGRMRTALFAHAQGIVPSRMAAFFRAQAEAHRGLEQKAMETIDAKGQNHYHVWADEQRDLDNAAAQWEKAVSKYGDKITPKMQSFMQHARITNRHGEDYLSDITPELAGSFERRAYVPLAQVAAHEGDTRAQSFLDLIQEHNRINERIPVATKRHAIIDQRIAQADRVVGQQDRVNPTEANRMDRITMQRADVLAHEHAPVPDVTPPDTTLLDQQIAQAENTYRRKLDLTKQPDHPAVERARADVTRLQAEKDAIVSAPQPPAWEPLAGPSDTYLRTQGARAKVEGRTTTKVSRPAERQLDRLQAQKLRAGPTPEDLFARKAEVEQQLGQHVNAIRNEYRATQKGAEPAAIGSALDEHDPVFFPHTEEGPGYLQKLLGGQTRGRTSTNMNSFLRSRGGTPGHMTAGELFGGGRATSDPRVWFGAAAKPFKIFHSLRHLQDQVSAVSFKAPPGTRYDSNHLVELRLNKGLNTKIHTTTDADQAIADLNEHNVLQKLMEHVHDRGKQGMVTVHDPDTILLPRDAIRNLNDTVKGLDNNTLKAAKRATNIWRWATLMARPAWLVNNIAGNALQAAIAGAGPTDWTRAMRKGKYGIPEGVENAGQYANLFDQQHVGHAITKPLRMFTDMVVRANVSFENLARRAVAMHHLTVEGKANVHGEIRTLRSHFHRVNPAVADFIRDPTPEAAAIATREVNKALGDFVKVRNTPGLDLAIPFHRWFRFIGELMLKMPVRTPGRALALMQLGQFGMNVQNQAFGGYIPTNKIGALQIPSWVPVVGGHLKSTQGLNPLATFLQLYDPNDASDVNPGAPGEGGVFGSINPLVSAAYEAASGRNAAFGNEILDEHGMPVSPMNLRVLGHSLEQSVPFASMIGGYAQPGTSLNPIGKSLPPKLGAQPRASLLDRAIGYAGGSETPFDTVLNEEVSQQRQKKAELAKAKAQYK